MTPRRKTAALVPYKIVDGKVYLFLQKRTVDAPLEPDYFGTFGGHLEEDESPEENVVREAEEELGFAPENFKFFRNYEFVTEKKDVFVLAVDDSFENEIKINEGQYGRFLSKKDIDIEEKISDDNRRIFKDLFFELNK